MDINPRIACVLSILCHKTLKMMFIVLDIPNFLKALEIELIWNFQ